jgi:hypothetical protein
MVVGVGFCKIKVNCNFVLVLKIKCRKFHQDRSKTVDLHTKYTNRHSVLYTRCPRTRAPEEKEEIFIKEQINNPNEFFFYLERTV